MPREENRDWVQESERALDVVHPADIRTVMNASSEQEVVETVTNNARAVVQKENRASIAKPNWLPAGKRERWTDVVEASARVGETDFESVLSEHAAELKEIADQKSAALPALHVKHEEGQLALADFQKEAREEFSPPYVSSSELLARLGKLSKWLWFVWSVEGAGIVVSAMSFYGIFSYPSVVVVPLQAWWRAASVASSACSPSGRHPGV